MMRHPTLFFALLGAVIFYAPLTAFSAASKRPDWVDRGNGKHIGPKGERFLHGVGIAEGIRNGALAAAAAEDYAFRELRKLLEKSPPETVKKILGAAKRSDVWRNGGATYVLVRVDVDATGATGIEWADGEVLPPEKELDAFKARLPELLKKAKEPPSEESRRFRVQAENAVAEKRFEDAAARYRKAVESSPWWADGYFNLALVLGELEHHSAAIVAMRKYLLLAPDAQDARAAQDKIYVWEDKLPAAMLARMSGKGYEVDFAKEEGVEEIPGGGWIKNLVAGTGDSPAAEDTVKLHYRGTLIDGTEFDNSYKRGAPLEAGLADFIPCWTRGIPLVKKGGKAKLVCPSDTAYGEEGRPPAIKGGATLVYEIELLDVLKSKGRRK